MSLCLLSYELDLFNVGLGGIRWMGFGRLLVILGEGLLKMGRVYMSDM
jgi:hypothetical protein